MSQIVKSGETPEPPPSQGREQAILGAARKRFAHYGFNKVTMEEVAEDVGVVKGSIYYYFPTKEELFKEVIRQEQNQFIAGIKAMLGIQLPAGEIIPLYVEKRQIYFHEMVNLSRLDFQAWVKMTSNYQDIFQNFEKEEIDILHQMFDKGLKSGEFVCSNTRKLAVLFLHVLQGLRLRSIKNINFDAIDEKTYAHLNQEIKYFVDVFLRGIIHNEFTKHS